jgi:hypothetical protein
MIARRSIKAQIAEVEREIAMRHKVYPGLVRKKTMKDGEAVELILLMQNVLATLREVERNGEDAQSS